MRELGVLTLHVDPGTGVFDNSPPQGYLAGRELVRWEPAFFVHEGLPRWSVFPGTRRLPAAEAVQESAPGSGPAIGKRGSPPAHRRAGLSARAAA